jgi:hypothetical protein
LRVRSLSSEIGRVSDRRRLNRRAILAIRESRRSLAIRSMEALPRPPRGKKSRVRQNAVYGTRGRIGAGGPSPLDTNNSLYRVCYTQVCAPPVYDVCLASQAMSSRLDFAVGRNWRWRGTTSCDLQGSLRNSAAQGIERAGRTWLHEAGSRSGPREAARDDAEP